MLDIFVEIAGVISDTIKDVVEFFKMIFEFIIESFDILPDEIKLMFGIIFGLLTVLLVWRFFK